MQFSGSRGESVARRRQTSVCGVPQIGRPVHRGGSAEPLRDVYAYAYGPPLVLSVYRRYTEQGEAFVPRYLDLLRAGRHTMAPEDLGRLVDCDLTDPGFSGEPRGYASHALTSASKLSAV